jgi:hypothetical protein
MTHIPHLCFSRTWRLVRGLVPSHPRHEAGPSPEEGPSRVQRVGALHLFYTNVGLVCHLLGQTTYAFDQSVCALVPGIFVDTSPYQTTGRT